MDSDQKVRIIAPVESEVGMDPFTTDNGAFLLGWEVSGGMDSRRVVVERSTSSEFDEVTIIYSGADDRTFISGLAAGSYFFRVRLDGAEAYESQTVSMPLAVEVEYQPLGRVFALMGFGAVTFVATLAIIIFGTLYYRRREGRNHG